jgi:hypothetical protein
LLALIMGSALVAVFSPVAGAMDGAAVLAKTVRQGEAFAVTVPASALVDGARPDDLIARFVGRDWPVFGTPDGVGVLMGVDLDGPLGVQDFVVERRGPDRATVVMRGAVVVEKGAFGTQTLSLPDKQVDLDAETLRRVETEQSAMLAAMQPVTPRLWDGTFVIPTEGKVQQSFGRRRVINGQPRNPHTGEDISAPQGAAVAAINHGTVRLVADQFFSGRSVVIDHGFGLYSMYFHLSDVSVSLGERVATAQVIGAVGATGRASGPHLHWGVRLNGVRINPLSLNNALNGVMTAAH